MEAGEVERRVGPRPARSSTTPGEIKDSTLVLDFLAVCFAYPAQALLNSTPQLLARDRCALAQGGAQLGPGDLRVDAAAQAVVGAGDDVFLADDFSERDVSRRANYGL
jgi:hypothetical protein